MGELRYGNIPDSLLNEVLNWKDQDQEGRLTLRDEINLALESTQGGKILNFDYSKDSDGFIKTFRMWSEEFVYTLVDSAFGGKFIIATRRAPGRSRNVPDMA